MKKVLGAIEMLAGDDFCCDLQWELANKRLRGRNKEMAERLSKIYRIAHAFNRSHECYSVHKNWRKLVEESRSA